MPEYYVRARRVITDYFDFVVEAPDEDAARDHVHDRLSDADPDEYEIDNGSDVEAEILRSQENTGHKCVPDSNRLTAPTPLAACPECGSRNVSAPDEAGLQDCFGCGIWFDPMHPDNQGTRGE